MFAEDADQFGGSVREARAAAANEVNVTGNVELLDFYFFHPAVLNFPLHAHARHDGYAHAHLHETLDAFDGGQLDGHVELGMMAPEKFYDATAKMGFDDMGDEGFAAEIGDVHFPLASQRMFGRDNERELIFEDFGGLQKRIARHVGNGAEVKAIVEYLVGNIAGKNAMDANLNARMFFLEDG